MNIIEIPTTSEMIKEAETKAKEMGRVNNSIRKGEGNTIGFLGELAFNEVLMGRIENTYDYDLVYLDRVKIDVKSKSTTVVPRSYYDASVCAKNIKQRCDIYAFGRVMDDYSCVWFCGMYSKQRYFKPGHALFHKKGERDPRNNFTFKEDCYNMEYGDMYMPQVCLRNAEHLGLEILTVS